jgi:hypothetical protein
MRGRTPAVAVTLVLTALLAGACSSSPSTSGAITTTTTSTRSTTTTAASGNAAVGTWSAAVRVAPGTILTAVSCPSAQNCVMGSSKGLTYGLDFTRVRTLGPAVPSPAPAGVSYLSCPTTSFCAAAPSLNQVALFNGTSWGAPTTIESAQGFTAVDCTGPGFCITIDGEGNSFALRGGSWSGNLGAWGAANQISCVSPTFCMAAEGGPSVWDGSGWTQPGDADSGGQLNAVSCATTTFCVLVDSSGAVLTWNGTVFSAPQSIVSEPVVTGTDAGGLTGVSCPTTTFCRAVDSVGRVFGWNGSTWSPGATIDKGHGLTAISCPTTTYCVAVDRAGNAFISGSRVTTG